MISELMDLIASIPEGVKLAGVVIAALLLSFLVGALVWVMVED